MPVLDGYQTLCEMKKSEELHKIPVIFITGLDSAKDEEKGLSLDAADYIVKPFNPSVVKLRVRNQIQIVNQLRTIECLSMVDQLTNIPNRRSFDERLKVEWKHAIREHEAISMMIIDLDRFKNVNDTYGHQQGDIVLQTIAGVFSKAIKRPSDFSARWGGEEFVVLMPNTVLEGAMDVAENLRSEVENTLIPNADGSEIKITISVGVTSFLPSVDDPMEIFFSNADKALYAAKEAGRNRVCSC
jgi:diguanylate cyclase (GGDEF)-like protein